MTPPYYLPETALISFSGGRSSAYMLRQIVIAHGGVLPDSVHVCFANTGRENQATLEFVREIERRWCKVVWLERSELAEKFVQVNFDSASRNGEPFEALIKKKQYLPNPIARFCTSDLKVIPMKNYMKSLGISDFTTVLGLRADEPRRVAKVTLDASRDVVCPMANAGATKQTVMEYWSASDFDLQLPNNDQAFGNCDLCFLKGRSPTDRVISYDPSAADWWIRMEKLIGGTFRKDRPKYHNIRLQVKEQGHLFLQDNDGTLPCDCTE